MPQLAHVGRIGRLGGLPFAPTGVSDLTLDYNYLLDSGSTIAQSVLKGPALTITRAGNANAWDSAGLLTLVTTNNPRYAHDPADSNARLGLRLEGQVEELVLQTEDFATTWNENGTDVISTNTTVAPDGETTADTITDNNGVGFESVNQNISGRANDETVTFSALVLKDAVVKTTRYAGFRLWFNGGTLTEADLGFDTSTGEAVAEVISGTGTLIGSGIEDLGLFWRPWLSFKNNATGNGTLLTYLTPAQGNNADLTTDGFFATGSIVIWGSNLTLGGLSSYIPATTIPVTRAPDVISSTITSILGAANTIAVSARTGYGTGVVLQIDDGTENERYRVERNASNEIHVIVTDGGVDVADLDLGAVADNTDFKVVARLAVNDFAASLDGAAVVTDTGGALPTVTTFRPGMDSSGDEWNSTIKENWMWNVGKSDAFLISEAAA